MAELGGRAVEFIGTEAGAVPEGGRVVPVAAEAVALLAGRRPGQAPETAEPLYIRPPDVREPK